MAKVCIIKLQFSKQLKAKKGDNKAKYCWPISDKKTFLRDPQAGENGAYCCGQ